MKRALPTSRVAIALLVMCCAFWGLSFPLMPIAAKGMEHLVGTNHGTGATVNAWRYAIAALCLAAITWRSMRHWTARDLRCGLTLGLLVGAGMWLQITGLRWVVPSVSGVLTALAVVFAPIAQSLIRRRMVGIHVWLASGVALIGTGVLALGGAEAAAHGHLEAPPFPWAGEILTILSAACFTGHILGIDRFAEVNADRLTVGIFTVVAVVNGAIGLLLGGAEFYNPSILSALCGNTVWMASMGVLILFCSIGAMWIMTAVQPAIQPATAAVLYTLEPVFAGLFSLAFGQENLTRSTVAGGSLIVLATLLAAQRRSPVIPVVPIT